MKKLWDNSALSTLLCKRKFQLVVLEGLYGPSEPSKAFGDAFHKAVELIDKGGEINASVLTATEGHDNVDIGKLLSTVTLFKTTVKLPPPIIIKDVPAIEYKVSYNYGNFINDRGINIEVDLALTIDRLYIDNGRLIICDYKTGAAFNENSVRTTQSDYELSFQLPFYTYALLKSGVLPPEYNELLLNNQYHTEIIFAFYNSIPPLFKKVRYPTFPVDFLHREVPFIINNKVLEAIKISQLDTPAPHDGMCVYKACHYCQFKPACLSMGTAKEDEYLSRFERREYNPLTFR